MTDTAGKKVYTHLVLTQSHPDISKPVMHFGLKEACDWAEEEIKKFPEITCEIFQLRTVLKGQINVLRDDYKG